MGRHIIACAFFVASAAFLSALAVAEPEKVSGTDIEHGEGLAEWTWSKALALATGQEDGDVSGWESVSVDQDATSHTTTRDLYTPSWEGSVRGGKWGYHHLPHITCPYGGAMQVEHYGDEVCFGVGQGICKNGWNFGIDKFHDTTYLMLWREENPAMPVYRWFPGATHLCIGEKYPNIAYLYVKFGNCVYYLVGPGAGSPDKLARLKIVPDTKKYSPYDTIVKFRDGAGSDDTIWQIFASGAFKTSWDASWHKKCLSVCGEFQDISTDGNVVVLPDDESEEVPMNNTFTFFGIDYTNVFVSTAGYVSFGDEDGDCPNCDDFRGEPFPDPVTPNNVIAPLWNDINPEDGGNITYKYVMNMPDKFITQWTEVPEYESDGNNTNTFQVALYFDSGCIEFRYGSLIVLNGGATAGVENINGTVGVNIPTAGIIDGNITCVRLCYDGTNYTVVDEQ